MAKKTTRVRRAFTPQFKKDASESRGLRRIHR
jgi:hypothetical protein